MPFFDLCRNRDHSQPASCSRFRGTQASAGCALSRSTYSCSIYSVPTLGSDAAAVKHQRSAHCGGPAAGAGIGRRSERSVRGCGRSSSAAAAASEASVNPSPPPPALTSATVPSAPGATPFPPAPPMRAVPSPPSRPAPPRLPPAPPGPPPPSPPPPSPPPSPSPPPPPPPPPRACVCSILTWVPFAHESPASMSQHPLSLRVLGFSPDLEVSYSVPFAARGCGRSSSSMAAPVLS